MFVTCILLVFVVVLFDVQKLLFVYIYVYPDYKNILESSWSLESPGISASKRVGTLDAAADGLNLSADVMPLCDNVCVMEEVRFTIKQAKL